MSYRIPHFFFINNKPTGVNYTSSVLSSVVYHDGADYPYLPGLPFYNGRALDNFSNLGFVGDCDARFFLVAQGHEQKLIDWNERFILLSNNYNERNIDIVLTWAFELSMALGIGDLLQGAYDWITGQLGEASVIAAQQAEADRVIASLVKRGNEVPIDYQVLRGKLDAATRTLNEDLLKANKLYEEARRLCIQIGITYGPDIVTGNRYYPTIFREQYAAKIELLQGIAANLLPLTGDRFWEPGRTFAKTSKIGRTLRVIETLTEEIRFAAQFADEAFEKLKGKISKIVQDSKKVKNLSWAGRLIAGLPALIKIIFTAIAKFLSVISIIGLIAIILYKTYEMLDKLSAVCSESATTLERLNKEKDGDPDPNQKIVGFYEQYIKSVESLLQDGCCDIKPCDPPICPNGQKHCPDAEGNCAPCESGSGSGSSTLGVGLQLLLETDGGSITKYIPVTLVGDGDGSGGGGGGGGGGTTTDHKPVCGFVSVESRSCPPNVDCRSEGMSVRFGELYQKYINDEIEADSSFKDPRTKTWLRGAETEHPPYTNIPNPKTACNDIPFVFDFGPQCSTYAPLYDAVAAAVSSLIPTSDTVSRAQLDAIREQDLGRRSRGAID